MKYLIALISVLAAVIAQILIKKASFSNLLDKSWFGFILFALLSYAVAFILQSHIMRFFPLSKIAPVTGIATLMLVFLCGVLLFNETIVIKQVIGVLFGLISIYLILG